MSIQTHAREGGTVGDEEVLGDPRVGDDDEELVAEPKRIERSELLVPMVEHELGVARQERERAWELRLLDDCCETMTKTAAYQQQADRLVRSG